MTLRRLFMRVIPPVAVFAAALVLTACPPPITPDLANVVQDQVDPVITITSPGNNSAFRSTLTVTGTVVDGSKLEGDGLGVLASISFEVGGAEYLSRTLVFDGDTITYDPPELAFDAYDPETGAFEITFSTAEPLLTGFRQITVRAIDEKGHEAEENITVYAYTDGPYVEITQPENGKSFETRELIVGRVTNGFGSDSTSEVDFDELWYRVGGKLTQIIDDPANGMLLDVDTGDFEVNHLFNPKPTGGIILEVTAKDVSGYESSASVELVDLPLSGLEFTSPGADTSADYYYSSVLTAPGEATITVAGTPIDRDEMNSIEWDTTGGGNEYPLTDSGYNPVVDTTFSFDVDLVTLDPTGNLTINIYSEDDGGRISEYSFDIKDDTVAPGASGIAGPGNAYVDVTFDEPMWGDISQASPVVPGNFTTSAPNGDPAITSVTTTGGAALVGGEMVVRLNLSFTSGEEPDEGQDLTLTPAGGSEPLDIANNRWAGTIVVPLQDQKRPEIDTITVGTVTGGLSGASTTYVNVDDTVDFTMTFSEPVTVSGSPILYLDLNQDGYYDGAYATYLSGAGTTHTFRYTVAAENTGPLFLDHVNGALSYQLGMSGVTILDGSNFPLLPGLPASGSIPIADPIVVDTIVPTTDLESGTVTARGGVLSAGYINASNTYLDIDVIDIPVGTDPSLVEGRIVVFADGVSLESDVTPGDADITASTSLTFDIVPANLQTTIPSTSNFTMRLYDAAGNEGPVIDLPDPTVDYDPPTAPSAIDVWGTGSPVVLGYINGDHTGFAGSATIVAGEATMGRARLYRSDPTTLLATDLSIGALETTVTFSVAGFASMPEGTYTITVELQDQAGNVTTGTMLTELTRDIDDPDAPDNIVVGTVGGNHVDGYLNSTNTSLTVDADITQGDATGGVARLYRAGTTELATSAIIGASDTGVTFTVTSLQTNLPTGGHTLTIDLWDAAGNVTAGTVVGALTADYGQPTVSAATSRDDDVDGDVETLAVTFSEDVVSGTMDETGWHMRRWTFDDSATPDSFEAGEYSSGGSDNGEFVLTPSTAGFFGTGEMEITIDADGVRDVAGNPIAAVSGWDTIAVTDVARPRVIGGVSLDDDHDGFADSLEVQFSEPIVDDVILDDATGPPPNYHWDFRVDGGSTYNFTVVSTSVSSITGGADNDADDEYVTLSTPTPAPPLTPTAGEGTGSMQIQFEGNLFMDGASTPNWNEPVGSWTSTGFIEDRAQAILVSASIDDFGTTGIFNSTNSSNDALYLVFTEDIPTSYTWDADSAEAFLLIANGGTDGNNFQDTTADESITLSYENNPNDYTLRIRLESRGNSGTSDNLIDNGHSVEVVANTRSWEDPPGTPHTDTFNDANGWPVYTSGSQVLPSVVGSPGTRSGGVVIGGDSGYNGSGSSAPSLPSRSTDTILLAPLNTQRGSAARTGGETPYVAPAVARLREQSVPAESSGTVSVPSASGATRIAVESGEPALSPKMPVGAPKNAAPVGLADVDTEYRIESAVETAGTVAPEDPVEIAQTVSPAQNPAATTVPSGAERGEGRGAAAVSGGGRNSAAAILALVAVMAILAGGALMVLSRMGRRREVGGRGANRKE